MNFIPYGRQNITDEDIDAVVNVLKSDYLTQGPKVPEFENAIKAESNQQILAILNATLPDGETVKDSILKQII